MTYEVRLMVGVPGSGKSTFCEEQCAYLEDEQYTTAIISRDYIRRGMIEGDINGDGYFAHEVDVFEEFVRQINEAMELGINYVFIDQTSLSPGSRKKILERLLPDPNTKLSVCYMSTPFKTCKERNAQRSGFALVPDSQLDKMIKGYRIPRYTEFPATKYGFKEINIVEV